MADKKDAKETVSRGADWEVVALTESTYAAAPGSKQLDINDDRNDESVGGCMGETSNPVFLSGHFVFPPSQHENLPLEPENLETVREQVSESVPDFIEEEGGRSDAEDEEDQNIAMVTESKEFPGIQSFDEKAWWKKHATCLYARAKEGNTVWSIFLAAAVMGLVILGQHWQQERWQVLQYKSQFGITDEMMSRMLGPLSRLKDLIIGGNRRGSLIRGSASREP